MMNIGIIGLGYVGLPLSLQFARSGVQVLGLDVDVSKVEAIQAGRSYIRHIDSAAIADMVKAGKLSASTDFSRVRELDGIIICVPTLTKTASLTSHHQDGRIPHLRKKPVVLGLRLSRHDGRGSPGRLNGSGEGGSVSSGLLPERRTQAIPEPGADIPKVVGLHPGLFERRSAYSMAVKTVCRCPRAGGRGGGETAHNIFRSVNIALVNELRPCMRPWASMCEVIRRRGQGRLGSWRFILDPASGHCIPIDPFS